MADDNMGDGVFPPLPPTFPQEPAKEKHVPTKKTRRVYTDEQKIERVQRVDDLRRNGMQIKVACEKTGINTTNYRRWIVLAGKGKKAAKKSGKKRKTYTRGPARSEEEKVRIVGEARAMMEDNTPLSTTARHFNLNPNTLRKWTRQRPHVKARHVTPPDRVEGPQAGALRPAPSPHAAGGLVERILALDIAKVALDKAIEELRALILG